jgi:hypothetical protein
MIRARIALFAALAGALALAGCDRNKDREAVRSETAATAGTPPTPPATAGGRGAAGAATNTAGAGASAVRDEDIPTIADFEEQAEKNITPANMETELARLEKEIAAGEPTTNEGAAPHQGRP